MEMQAHTSTWHDGISSIHLVHHSIPHTLARVICLGLRSSHIMYDLHRSHIMYALVLVPNSQFQTQLEDKLHFFVEECDPFVIVRLSFLRYITLDYYTHYEVYSPCIKNRVSVGSRNISSVTCKGATAST